MEATSTTDSEDGTDGAIVDFHAPDRMRSIADRIELPMIGSTTYLSVTGRPGYFRRVPRPDRISAGERFLYYLRILEKAGDVEKVNGRFRFTLPSGLLSDEGGVEGEAVVGNGRITEPVLRYRLDGAPFTVRLAFSMFGSAPPVDAPPP